MGYRKRKGKGGSTSVKVFREAGFLPRGKVGEMLRSILWLCDPAEPFFQVFNKCKFIWEI